MMLKELKKAVNRQLSKTGVEVMSQDVKEGFNEPSFFSEFKNIQQTPRLRTKSYAMIVAIYYFPADSPEKEIELLAMSEELSDLFSLKLRVGNRLLNIENYVSTKSDGVLTVTFELNFEVSRNDEWKTEDQEEFEKEYPVEIMEELQFKKE